MNTEATTLESRKLIYTTTDKADKNMRYHATVYKIDALHYVTYRHGPHSTYSMGQQIQLFNLEEPSIRVQATVVSFNDNADYLVFKGDAVNNHGGQIRIGLMFIGQQYCSLGIDEHRLATFDDGVVRTFQGGFYFGNSHCEIGDSGSCILTPGGEVLGHISGRKEFKSRDARLSETAYFKNTTVIVPVSAVLPTLDVKKNYVYTCDT